MTGAAMRMMAMITMMVPSTSYDIARHEYPDQNKATQNFLETEHINSFLVNPITTGSSVWLTLKSKIFTSELVDINNESLIY
jgi:hypothetical protein